MGEGKNTDIVERLTLGARHAISEHYSLGMASILKDAADTITSLRSQQNGILPPALTEPMIRAALRAGYIHVGASESDADQLADERLAKPGEMELAAAQYQALLKASHIRSLLPLHEACVEALRGIGDDYMTSERHHPGYVLIPTSKFEQMQAALSALDQALGKPETTLSQSEDMSVESTRSGVEG